MNRNDLSDLPLITTNFLDEPLLVFADNRQHEDPKTGIARFGPKSLKPLELHPSIVRVGLIGSGETVEKARLWIEKCSDRVVGDDAHPEFPGFKKDRGFFSELQFDDAWVAKLSHAEIDTILDTHPAKVRFADLVAQLESKLRFIARKDYRPDYVVLAIPNELYRKCRVVNYRDKHLGDVHRDLRRAFKALAMKYQIPTQLLREETMDERVELTLSGRYKKDHPSEIAWDFFTGLYFKAGGSPWGPCGLTPGTCYIGISFYRPIGSNLTKMQTSLVQAFDEHGNGLVLRGPDFTWDPDKEATKSPHLTDTLAERIVNLTLDRYQEEMKQSPARVVVHKTSRYWPAEKEGFEQALQKRVGQYDLVAMSPQSAVRLIPSSLYPPLRGTYFSVDDLDYLYTTGFLATLGQFHSVHVPAPIQIADHIGQDTPREILIREILTLTKMNWNSSKLGGNMPITLRFSRLVGDIMKEIQDPDQEPLPNFKFYM